MSSSAFRTPEDYELFLYTLVEQFPVISRSTLVFVRVGASMARVTGERKQICKTLIRITSTFLPT